MKTSNKLMIGFFGLVLAGMIIYNFALTKEIKKSPMNNIMPNNMINNYQQQDSLLINVDSASLNNSESPQK